MSFCIPVYNNAEAAVKTVSSILSSPDSRFEVVVSDNASDDNVQELLSQVHDPRFRYHRNDKNLGAHKNWEKALELGRGIYLFLSMVRDRLYGDKITNLIDILEHAHKNNITLLQDGYNPNTEYQIYNGIDAMIKFVKIDHPTATIFNRECFQSIPDRTRYFEISDMYPENYVRRDLLLMGQGAVIFSGVYSREGDFYNMKKANSTVECGKDIHDMYFAPRRKAVQTFELLDMIGLELSGTFSEADVNKYFKARFYELLGSVSLGWRWQCTSETWQAYYGQKVRHVSIREMLGNIITAYRSTKSHLQNNGTFTPSKQRVMYLCTVKAFMNVLVYFPVKSAVKKVLEPLGIWKVLKTLKRKIKNSPA